MSKSSHGVVVDHKESRVRYAVSDKNFNSKIHTKVRDLAPGETVRGFQPKPIGALVDPYSKDWTVGDLQSEIDRRNAELGDDEQIVPGSNKKADLVAALLLDDEALAKSNDE